MKVGIFLLTENFHESSLLAIQNDIELAVYAEQLGFDEVWFAEHHFNSFSVIPNPSLMMTYLAAKTKKIRIGSAAFLAPFYNPIRLAEEIATLDNLSHGRINAGFAKGGFALDMEYFDKTPEELRESMYSNVKKTEYTLYENSAFQPKTLQEKIPFYIATFSTKESIEFAAKNGYGLMFSQGATLEQCEDSIEYYHSIAGFYPEVVLMRVFSAAKTHREAKEMALVATDHFVRSMRAVRSKKEQPSFNKQNYEKLLEQRYDFFDAKTFMDAAIVGTDEECIEQIQQIKKRIKNLHLVLKVASSDISKCRAILHSFAMDIRPNVD